MRKSVSGNMEKINEYIHCARRLKRQFYYVSAVKEFNKALALINDYEYDLIDEDVEISEYELAWKKFWIKVQRYFTVHSLGGSIFFDLDLEDYYETLEEYKMDINGSDSIV